MIHIYGKKTGSIHPWSLCEQWKIVMAKTVAEIDMENIAITLMLQACVKLE